MRLQLDRWGSIVTANVEPPVINTENDKSAMKWCR